MYQLFAPEWHCPGHNNQLAIGIFATNMNNRVTFEAVYLSVLVCSLYTKSGGLNHNALIQSEENEM